MEKDVYLNKMIEAINKIPNKPIKIDPTENIIRKIAKVKNDPRTPDTIKEYAHPPTGATMLVDVHIFLLFPCFCVLVASFHNAFWTSTHRVHHPVPSH